MNWGFKCPHAEGLTELISGKKPNICNWDYVTQVPVYQDVLLIIRLKEFCLFGT